MKFSLTLILFSLVIFSSCSSIPDKNNSKLKLQLNIQTSNKNKEKIIESLLKDDVIFSINFNDENSYLMEDDVLNSNLKYFCNSFIQDQRNILENNIFNTKKSKNKKVLVIYSDSFKNIYFDLAKKYPEQEYLFVNNSNYESEIKKILNVDSSLDKYLYISSIYQENEMLHSPRIRNDISSIYFLTDYELGKTIVPIFRNYSLDINFYSSTEIFHEANDIKKLLDFESTYIPFNDKLIESIINKKTPLIKDEIERILINDFLVIEKIYQNNLFRKNIFPESGNLKIQRSGCINRNLSLWKVSTSNYINQI